MKKPIYAGLYLVALGTLMYEILLPRIFSVTMFYHFAFMAVSLAMFGMTVGALIVYLRRERFPESTAARDMAQNASLFAVTSVLCLFVYLKLPILGSTELEALPWVILSFLLIAVPFVFSGITVALALTRFPAFVGKLYAADLAGAATGCLVIMLTLEHTDAPTAAIVTATFISIGAAAFALATSSSRLKRITVVAIFMFGGAAFGHHALAKGGRPPMRIAQGIFAEVPRRYARWNSFSYVEVIDAYEPASGQALGWGMSSTLPPDLKVHQFPMDIDIKAGTPITEFHGDTKQLEFLRYDVTNAVHHVRHGADFCVIGVGGGRDILSSLYFDQRSVLGIELNPNVLGAITGPFAEFTGHLDRNPKVSLIVDEGRSRMARMERPCDVIQISLIDTFAATAAGAFVLAENSLYTLEAWSLFLSRLTPSGVLSVSRYYYHQRPAEAYRMMSLAVAGLERNGITDYRSHLVLIKNQSSFLAGGAGIGTLLVSKAPWSQAELQKLKDYAASMDFEIVLDPSTATEPVLERIASGKDLETFYAGYEIDVSPPTDDRPFFFQMLRLRDVFSSKIFDPNDVNWKNAKAILVVVALFVIVSILAVACIVVPLVRTRDRKPIRRGRALLVFFGAIGLGFMFIEMAQMQRLMVFLGRPTYALSVVLFTLLLSSGVGSFVAHVVMQRASKRALVPVFATLAGLLLVVGLVSPVLMARFESAMTLGRILLAVGLLAPLGLVMGMPFPIGMRHAEEIAPSLSPWLWGINGAASVWASVLAVIIALSLGIGASYWAGFGCYLIAGAVYLLAIRATTEPGVATAHHGDKNP